MEAVNRSGGKFIKEAKVSDTHFNALIKPWFYLDSACVDILYGICLALKIVRCLDLSQWKDTTPVLHQ